jgi:hypothetical protein
VISVYTHGVGIPIWFECLDNEGGNSDSDDRAYVLLSCIKHMGKERIKCIIGDCELGQTHQKKKLDLSGYETPHRRNIFKDTRPSSFGTLFT